ncbi:MAG: hypothetical protein M3Y87_09880 [Myxococcota bacterium]|nr:hypothetical protein [Myxococcota bacterium]
MWLDDQALRARSSGAVETPESYNGRTYLPEARGLCCERIFGAVGWSAGDLARIAHDDRAERWGHIELAIPNARAEGEPERAVVMVVPPFHRRWLVLSADESRTAARARRAELLALEASGRWPYCDPLEKLLAEEGLIDEADVEAREGGLIEPPLSCAYRSVINLSNRLRRYVELGAPEAVCAPGREALAAACARLDTEIELAQLPDAIVALAQGRDPLAARGRAAP